MKFGLSTSPQRTTWPWLREVWKRADQQPIFESAWTFDHIYPLSGNPDADCFDGWMTLAALLHETQRLRGGVLVSGMVYRHPGILAKMAATLDVTSGGRLELGVGAGWFEPECAAYGIELGSMTERFDRMQEGLDIVTSLLAGKRTTADGVYYHLRDAVCRPKPVQDRVPVCIGGRGRHRTLPLVARYADHWNFSGTEVEEFLECREVLRSECEAIGRNPDEITCSVELRSTVPATLRRDVDAFDAANLDLGLIELPKDAPPSIVDDLAQLLGGR